MTARCAPGWASDQKPGRMEERPLSDPKAHRDLTPEARRKNAVRLRQGVQARLDEYAGPVGKFFSVVRRVWTGAYYDGFIHAGNLAYMSLLALFPFFIVLTAIVSALGEPGQRDASIDALLTAVPRDVAKVLSPVAHEVSRTVLARGEAAGTERLVDAALEELESDARGALTAAGADPETLSVERWIDARYRGQSFELAVPALNWLTSFHDFIQIENSSHSYGSSEWTILPDGIVSFDQESSQQIRSRGVFIARNRD